MKKLFSVLILSVFVLALALSGCSGTNKTAATVTYGEVGTDPHCFFPYAIVSVDKDGNATAVEIGEAFGPSGRLSVSGGTASYGGAWYPGINVMRSALSEISGEDALLQKQQLIADKYFISIDGDIFNLTVQEISGAHALVFEERDGDTVLSDGYLAENMDWYISAIKADRVFICDSEGAKLAADDKITMPDESQLDAKFPNGALLKNDPASTYSAGRGLDGVPFKRACDEMATFAKTRNFAIEYEEKEGGNHEGLRVKGLVLTAAAEDSSVTSATSKDKDTFLNYSASYMKIAEKAFAKAKQALS